jgi:hypothetical protein
MALDIAVVRAQLNAYLEVCDQTGRSTEIIEAIRFAAASTDTKTTELRYVHRDVITRIRETFDELEIADWERAWRREGFQDEVSPLKSDYSNALRMIRQGHLDGPDDLEVVRAQFDAIWQPFRDRYPEEYELASRLLDKY